MVHLTEAGAQFTRTRSGSGNKDNRSIGFNIGVCSVAFVTDDRIDIGWIAAGVGVGVYGNSALFEDLLKLKGVWLTIIAGDHHLVDAQAPLGEIIDHLKDVGIVGNAKVTAHLSSLDITAVDTDDHIDIVCKRLKDTHLHVGIKTGKDAGGVIVEEELTPALQVELSVTLFDALKNVMALLL